MSPQFIEAAEELSKPIKSKLLKILRLLSSNYHHPGLQTKKVKSSKAELFECRVDLKIRLIYDIEQGLLRCWFVGPHDDALQYAESQARSQFEIVVDDIEIQHIDERHRIVWEYLAFGSVSTRFRRIELQGSKTFSRNDQTAGPIFYLKKAFAALGISLDERIVLLGLDAQGHYRRFMCGDEDLWTRDARDRVRCLIEIDAALNQLFRKDRISKAWLREANAHLEGRSPLSLMLEGSLESVILVRQFIESLSGR